MKIIKNENNKKWNKNKIQNLKLIGISTLFLMATVIGLTSGYFSSRKISDDKTTGGKTEQKVTLNVQSAKLTKAGLARIRNDIIKLQNAKAKDGADGKQGERGSQGVGIKGGKGATGPVGPTGPIGKRGLTGGTGAQGRKGDKGIPGERGPSANIQPLERDVAGKLDKTEVLPELLKVLTRADDATQNTFYNVIAKPGLRTDYFNHWINKNKNNDLDQTSDLTPTDKIKNSFWQKAGHLFTNLQESNEYLFRNLDGDGNNPTKYGLYGRVDRQSENPVSFVLKKYSNLIMGTYRRWTGFNGDVKTLSAEFQIT